MSRAAEWKYKGKTEEINGGIKQSKVCVFPPGEMKEPEEGWRELVAAGEIGVGFLLPLDSLTLNFNLICGIFFLLLGNSNVLYPQWKVFSGASSDTGDCHTPCPSTEGV